MLGSSEQGGLGDRWAGASLSMRSALEVFQLVHFRAAIGASDVREGLDEIGGVFGTQRGHVGYPFEDIGLRLCLGTRIEFLNLGAYGA